MYGRLPLFFVVFLRLLSACEVPDPEPEQTLRAKTQDDGSFKVARCRSGATADCMETITYDRTNRLRMDLYYPNTESLPHGEPHGVIFFAHGGAWVSGSRKALHPAAIRAYREGWIVVSPDYRLARYDLFGRVEDPFPTALLDIQRAMRHAKYHLSEVAQKLQRGTAFLGMGHSAGGHLVGLAAVSAHQAPFEPRTLSAAERRYDTSVRGVVALAAPLDLLAILDKGIDIPHDDLENWLWYNLRGTREAITAFLDCPVRGDLTSCLCDPELRPERCGTRDLARVASLHTYYDPTDPPFYTVFAQHDSLSVVPIAGCALGAHYLQDGRPLHFIADVIECAPTASGNPQACDDHDLNDMNATALDAWLSAMAAGGLPEDVAEGEEERGEIVNLCGYP